MISGEIMGENMNVTLSLSLLVVVFMIGVGIDKKEVDGACVWPKRASKVIVIESIHDTKINNMTV